MHFNMNLQKQFEDNLTGMNLKQKEVNKLSNQLYLTENLIN